MPDANTTLVGIDVTQTLTNKTLTSPTINGGAINSASVGATTASTGAFTTLSASSTVSGTGFSTYLASPPAIGGTAAAAGAFTTLSASSTVSGTGFSTYLASPPAIGGTAAAAGTFTTLSSTGNTTIGDAVADTITVNGQFVTGTVLRSAQTATNTLALAAYDTDGAAYTNLITLTASTTPTLALTSTGVGTINNMSIGATTASTGAFTTLSASSTVSGTGFSTYLASPPAIGGTAAAAGAFTTLSATGVTTVQAGTALLPAITTTGDTNTGIFFPAADVVGVSTGGSEKVRIDTSGSVGIGATALTQFSLRLGKNITGNVDSYAVRSDGVVQSDVTSSAALFATFASTQAASFTLTNLRHFQALQSTIGATSTVTNQYGFYVDSSLTGATTNIGFFSDIAAASARWNLYMGGTANNYMAGSLGIGQTSFSASLDIGKTITGGVSWYGIRQNGTIQSDVTSGVQYNRTVANTAAAAFTLSSLWHYIAVQSTIGAGSAVTNQYGYAVDTTLTGATNNYGFHSGIASGTGRWNFYAAGTADNYFAGNVGIGTTSPSGKLHVAGGANSNDLLTSSTGTTYLIMGNVDGSVNAKYSYVGAASQYLLFGKVSDDLATRTEFMRIDNSGNVGIGTTSPSGRLNIATGASASCTMRFTSNGTGTGAGDRGRLDFYSADNSGTAYQLGYMDYDRADGTGTASYIAWANRVSGTVAERMRIDTSGNLLVGTTSQIRSGFLSVSGVISTNNNINWGPAGNGRIFSDVNWGCIFQADRASPASADFLWQNSAGTTRLTIDTAGSLNLAGAYTEAVVAIGTVTTASTISLANGTVQTATLTASTACTFTMPTAVAGKSFVLLLKQAAATGNGTATFTSVKWSSAGAPTITATAGKMDILTFASDGTNWYGSAAQGYTP